MTRLNQPILKNAGPGWSNQGLTISWEDRITGVRGERYVYGNEMTKAQHDAWRVLLLGYELVSESFKDETEVWE